MMVGLIGGAWIVKHGDKLRRDTPSIDAAFMLVRLVWSYQGPAIVTTGHDTIQ